MSMTVHISRWLAVFLAPAVIVIVGCDQSQQLPSPPASGAYVNYANCSAVLGFISQTELVAANNESPHDAVELNAAMSQWMTAIGTDTGTGDGTEPWATANRLWHDIGAQGDPHPDILTMAQNAYADVKRECRASRPALPPSATTPPSPTYSDGYTAGQQAASSAVTANPNDNAPGWKGDISSYCGASDPDPEGSKMDDQSRTASRSIAGTPWFRGCVAGLLTRPVPGPPPGSPTYQQGYKAGLTANAENVQMDGAKGWCKEYSPYQSGDQDTIDANWIKGCTAAIRATGGVH
jgi:hypothetical protein